VAVRSLDLVGASSHTPALLTAAPPVVAIGNEIPAGYDAVIDPAALSAYGPMIEIAETVEPGAHVRFAGHDLRAGDVLAERGERISAELALVLAKAGFNEVDVLAIPASLDGLSASPERRWLEQKLRGLGCLITHEGNAALVLRTATREAPPRLALEPGATSWIEARDGRIVIDIPGRFEGCIAAFAALILPAIAHMAAADIMRYDAILPRKLSSRVGTTEIALLRNAELVATPLGIGDLTLMHLAQANAFLLLPPDLEGYAAGSRIMITPFDAKLTARCL
jgi:molybdopterin biosynthesis enzyme